VAIDITQQVNQIATTAAQQAAAGVVADLQARLTAVEATAQQALQQQAPVLIADAATAGTAVLHTVETDPALQRNVVYGLVAACIIGALVILVAALLGNATANSWIGAAPGLIVGAILWVSKAQLPAASKPAGTVTTTTTPTTTVITGA